MAVSALVIEHGGSKDQGIGAFLYGAVKEWDGEMTVERHAQPARTTGHPFPHRTMAEATFAFAVAPCDAELNASHPPSGARWRPKVYFAVFMCPALQGSVSGDF